MTILLLVLVSMTATILAADWPMFGHDVRRSQQTDEQLDIAKLQVAWRWRSVQPPLPAWGQPAKGDAYSNLRDFASMRNYDPVFHPIIVGDSVFFGSNVDDSVRCLDLITGEVRWIFTAGGPVRIAPTFADGRIYFGADDGYAYCVNAEDGELLWKFSPSLDEIEKMVLNNGRLISFWPCRTGVLVDDGTAYFGCSLLPWKSSFLCAVDAKTGKAAGDGRYVQRLEMMTLEGPLVAGSEMLYAPQGREAPLQFQRSTGKHLGTLRDGFGAFCVLTPDNHLLHGPRKKGGGIVDSDAATRSPVATHKDARAMIVSHELSLMMTANELAAADLASRKMLWKRPISEASAMVLAGGHVLLGKKDGVLALSKESGEPVWQAGIDGRVFGMAVGDGALIVSTDTGEVVCFRAGDKVIANQDVQTETTTRMREASPIEEFADDHLLGRWVFSPLAVEESGTTFRNLAGGLGATISGPVALEQFHGLDGIALDGKQHSISITDDLSKAKLPTQAMSAEAWVRIDNVQEWGGLVGATQDNGSYERGWLLGFRKQRFSLSLAGKEGPGRLTYLNAEDEFTLGQWHHVVGTYDGATMRVYVDGKVSATSNEQKGEINYPPQTFYEIAAYHDDNEHYRTTGMVHEVRVYDRVLSDDDVAKQFAAKKIVVPSFAKLAASPRIQFDSSTSAVMQWETEKASVTKLVLRDERDHQRVIEADAEAKMHRVRIDKLKRDRRYAFQIQVSDADTEQSSRPFELDTYFNYHLAELPRSTREGVATDERYVAAADEILANYRKQRGLCLVIGSQTGELAMELARRGNLRVIGLETDAASIASAREKAISAGLYGPRCSFVKIASLDKLPVSANIANLVVSQHLLADDLSVDPQEIERVLQPGTGRLVLLRQGKSKEGSEWAKLIEKFEGTSVRLESVVQRGEFDVLVGQRGRSEGTGEWTHMYGDASNAAYAGETLSGATEVGQLEAAWLGMPGPRYQTDRQNRKSAPLFAGGRLYMQGQERIIALDGYNGVILWSREMPGMLRFNIPRDVSNWCCDDEHLYVAVGDRCLQIDGETGEIQEELRLPVIDRQPKQEWGYVARSGDWLLGSAVRPNSMFTEFWGVDFWFDQHGGVYTHQVCSQTLFARRTSEQSNAWEYGGGLIWNATLTADGKHVFFIESRNVELADDESSRITQTKLTEDAWLVALALETGERSWEQKLDISPKTAIANMAYSDGTLLLVTSYDNKFPVRAFDAADGTIMWDTTVPWPRNHHGGHLSRPAIVGEKLFVRPAVLELKTGKLLSNNMPGGGCGTYVCSSNALFFRAGSQRQLSTWHPDSGRYTHWPRMRPDCWLSTIVAGGMLLSPEGGGGCSCGHWMEMSVGFVPKKRSSEE